MPDAKKWTSLGFDSVTYSLDASVFIQSFQSLVQAFYGGGEAR